MTPAEQRIEMDYRASERCGVLCEDGPITESALAIARQEAETWRKQWLLENPEDGQMKFL